MRPRIKACNSAIFWNVKKKKKKSSSRYNDLNSDKHQLILDIQKYLGTVLTQLQCLIN